MLTKYCPFPVNVNRGGSRGRARARGEGEAGEATASSVYTPGRWPVDLMTNVNLIVED